VQIKIKVIPNATKNRVVEETERLKVYVSAPATGGKANKAVITLLAKHLQVRKNEIAIVKGEKSREKVIAVVKT
jgi:uncharacterized protein (TIGR00251 family)